MKFNNDPTFLKKRAEAAKQKQADPNFGSTGRDFIFTKSVTMFKGHDGENSIRICPNPMPGALFPWIPLFIHYRIGVNESQYLCLAKMKNMPCPICEEHKKVKDSNLGKEEKDEALSRLYAAERATVYLIDRLESDPTRNPQIWPMPAKKVAENILGLSTNKKTGGFIFVDDPQEGYDISFKRIGKDRATDYKAIQIDREPSPLHEDPETASKWLDVIEGNSLHEILNFKTYDYIKAVLNGEDPNLENVKPITSAASKVKTSRTEPEPKTPSLDNIPVGEGLSLAKLAEMDQDDLVKLIEERNMDLTPEGWDDVEDLRQAIALELAIIA
jgi:gp32 DNA binding protein like